MTARAFLGLLFVAAAFLLVWAVRPALAAEAYDLPKLDGITIDGQAADWGERGLRVDMLAAEDGRTKSPADFNVSFRLGWNDEGLLLLATVEDDVPVESLEPERLYENDSFETFVASKEDGSGSYLQVIIAPGMDPKTPEPRVFILDRKTFHPSQAPVRVARIKVAGGYVLEALYPWSAIGVTPKVGAEVWYGFWANDADQLDRSFQVLWAPMTQLGSDLWASHRLRLSDHASAPVVALVRGNYVHFRRTEVDVLAAAAQVGKTVEVTAGGKALGRGPLEERNGRAHALVSFPLPTTGESWPALAVSVGGQPTATISLPDLEETRARAVIDLKFSFQSSVFSGAAFPSGDFEDPNLAEDLLGPYTLETTFYDANYHEVLAANEPGRYGAVVKMTPRQGRARLYFRTLFALPRGMSLTCKAELPPPPGHSPAVVEKNAAAINRVMQQCLTQGAARDGNVAALLAGVYETSPDADPITAQTDIFARDRQWWVGLKRKLYGMEQAYPADFVCPRPKEGAPAPVLHAGTLAAAGMKPDSVEKLDALLTKWAANSDQSFGVCIARHGVVILEKAYGQRDGRPMTLTDKSGMASITKLIAGTALMMAVDQGRLQLDDPVTKYLPSFRGAKMNKELTIRHLYNHTNSLWGHWGDNVNDLDQLLGWYAPHIQVGLAYNYNGLDMALGGKILELVTGEALPSYYKHHLLDPLGLVHTDVVGSSADARSTARDIATIGQMLLNKGVYGDQRFFSEATALQRMPQKITRLVPNDTTTEYGVASAFFKGEGLGEGTWGTGAASGATIRIDPVNDLVIAMTRNEPGRGYEIYHPQFLKLVAECVER